MADNEVADFIASHVFNRRKPDGTIVQWRQEDESAVTCKADAVGVLQRMIDFWVPKVATDLQQFRGNSADAAWRASVETCHSTLQRALNEEPFYKRWGITLADLSFPIQE